MRLCTVVLLLRLLSTDVVCDNISIFPDPKDCISKELCFDLLQEALEDGGIVRKMFRDYDKEMQPTKPVTIEVQMFLVKIVDLLEKHETLTTSFSLKVNWMDTRLSWDPADPRYRNMSVLTIDQEDLWMPDVGISNSANDIYYLTGDMRFKGRLTNNGVVTFVPTGSVISRCKLDLSLYPFDTQTCSLSLESWSLESTEMIISRNSSIQVIDEFYHESGQWELCSVKTNIMSYTYVSTQESFDRIIFTMTLKRKSTYYVVNLLFPCMVLSLLQQAIYLLPGESVSDRVQYGMANLLTLVVFHTIITGEMPKSSESITLLSKYVLLITISAAVGVIISVASGVLVDCEEPPPFWMKYLFICYKHSGSPGNSVFRRGFSKIASRGSSGSSSDLQRFDKIQLPGTGFAGINGGIPLRDMPPHKATPETLSVDDLPLMSDIETEAGSNTYEYHYSRQNGGETLPPSPPADCNGNAPSIPSSGTRRQKLDLRAALEAERIEKLRVEEIRNRWDYIVNGLNKWCLILNLMAVIAAPFALGSTLWVQAAECRALKN